MVIATKLLLSFFSNLVESRIYDDTGINFDNLVEKFIEVQNKHKEFKKAQRTKEISTLDKEIRHNDV